MGKRRIPSGISNVESSVRAAQASTAGRDFLMQIENDSPDKTYYDYLPLVKSFVIKWGMPDDQIRRMLDEVLEDANSFAYEQWAILKDRFKPDIEAASRYYVKTIKFKLIDYLNKFYKHKSYQDVESPNVMSFDDLMPCMEDKIAYVDAYADDDIYFTENMIDTRIHQEAITLLINELQNCCSDNPKRQEAMAQLISGKIEYLLDHPKEQSSRGARSSYKITQTVFITMEELRTTWYQAKEKFKKAYPELKQYMTTGDDRYLDIVIERIESRLQAGSPIKVFSQKEKELVCIP